MTTAPQQVRCRSCTGDLDGVAILRHQADADQRRYCSIRCLQQHHLLSWQQVRELKKAERSESWAYGEFDVETQDEPCEAQCTLCSRKYLSEGEIEVTTSQPWYRGWCPKCIAHVDRVVEEGINVTTATTAAANGAAKPGKEFLGVPVDETQPPPERSPLPEEWALLDDIVPNILPGYRLSNWGRIMSPDSPNGKKGQEIHGYSPGGKVGQALWISLRTKTPGQSISVRIDKLVLTTFVCPVPSHHHVVCHIDTNASNSRVDNLKWVHKDSEEERERKSRSAARATATRRKKAATPVRGRRKADAPVAPPPSRARLQVSRVYKQGDIKAEINDDNIGYLNTKGPLTPQDWLDLADVAAGINEMNKVMGLV